MPATAVCQPRPATHPRRLAETARETARSEDLNDDDRSADQSGPAPPRTAHRRRRAQGPLCLRHVQKRSASDIAPTAHDLPMHRSLTSAASARPGGRKRGRVNRHGPRPSPPLLYNAHLRAGSPEQKMTIRTHTATCCSGYGAGCDGPRRASRLWRALYRETSPRRVVPPRPHAHRTRLSSSRLPPTPPSSPHQNRPACTSRTVAFNTLQVQLQP
ncbi:hypothetical protein BC628DRAFT_1402172 [Trametes gibbosa]|nr:hypothetical protein BC628DRAFT_1402172 [Trametes gibbosa]